MKQSLYMYAMDLHSILVELHHSLWEYVQHSLCHSWTETHIKQLILYEGLNGDLSAPGCLSAVGKQCLIHPHVYV